MIRNRGIAFKLSVLILVGTTLILATVCIALELLMHGQGYPTDPLEEHGPFLLALAFASVSHTPPHFVVRS